MATVNIISIQKKAKGALESGLTARKVNAILKERVDIAASSVTDLLTKEFDRHPVTKELTAGPEGRTKQPNFPIGPRGTKYGNLVAYFGLDAGTIDSGLNAIRNLFSKRKISIKRTGTIFTATVSFPEIDEYYKATPPPEDAYPVSWLQAMEQSLVKNFSNFLFRLRGFPSGASRSGTGVQVKNKLRAASGFPRIPYITEIYRDILGAGGRGKATILKAVKKSL